MHRYAQIFVFFFFKYHVITARQEGSEIEKANIFWRDCVVYAAPCEWGANTIEDPARLAP